MHGVKGLSCCEDADILRLQKASYILQSYLRKLLTVISLGIVQHACLDTLTLTHTHAAGKRVQDLIRDTGRRLHH